MHESFYLSKESASIHQSTEEVRNMWSYVAIPHRPSWCGAHFSRGKTLIGILMVLRLLKRAVSANRETGPLWDIIEHTSCIIHRGKSTSRTNIGHRA